MRMFLISDNVDTEKGMRLGGVKGCVVHEKEEFQSVLEAALADRENAIVAITEKLFDLMPDYIMERKLRESLPLIVKIPDRHGRRETSEDMMRYISEAMGIKF